MPGGRCGVSLRRRWPMEAMGSANVDKLGSSTSVRVADRAFYAGFSHWEELVTAPLDMDAIKSRDAWCFGEDVGSYRHSAREDETPQGARSCVASVSDAYLDRRDLMAEVRRLKDERLRYLGALGYILSNKEFSPLVRGFVVNVIEETPGAACTEERNDTLMLKIATELQAAKNQKQ